MYSFVNTELCTQTFAYQQTLLINAQKHVAKVLPERERYY